MPTKSSFYDITLLMRLNYMITTIPAPYAFFLALSGNSILSKNALILSSLELFFVSIFSFFVLLLLNNPRLTNSVAVLISIVEIILFWDFNKDILTSTIFATILFSVVFRIHILITSKNLQYNIHQSLKIDSFMIILIIIITWFNQLSINSAGEFLVLLIAYLCVASIVLRIIGVWIIETSEILTLTPFIILLSTALLLIASSGNKVGTLSVVLFILVSITLLIARIREFFFGYLLLLLYLIWVFYHKNNNKTELLPHLSKSNSYQILTNQNGSHSSFTQIVISILICLILSIFLLKRGNGIFIQKNINLDSTKIISRQRIRKKEKTLKFVETSNQIRLKYQSWLRLQSTKGYTIKTNETPRAFLNRIETNHENQEITSEYEKVRYNE